MPRPKSDKTSAEDFIKAVMRAESIREAAEILGVSRQAVSKRLREYKERGVKGLPDFEARTVDVEEVQKLVNKLRR